LEESLVCCPQAGLPTFPYRRRTAVGHTREKDLLTSR
jgi:hypothetical protein